MSKYFDANISDAQMAEIAPAAMKTTARFDAIATRKYLQGRGFLSNNLVRYCYRPFDVRWLYWEPETKLLDEKRAEYWPHIFEGNLWMEGRSRIPQSHFDRGLVTPYMGDNMGNGLSNYFPLYLRNSLNQSLFAEFGHGATKANLSDFARDYLEQIGLPDDAKTLFLHALAIQHAPRYRTHNADALRLDWPRIPLPELPQELTASTWEEDDDTNLEELGEEERSEWEAEREAAKQATTTGREELLAPLHAQLEKSRALGERITALLDVSQPLAGVTTGTIEAHLQLLGPVTRVGGGVLNPQEGDLSLSFNWGYRASGAVMPGSGRIVEREWTPFEYNALTQSSHSTTPPPPNFLNC